MDISDDRPADGGFVINIELIDELNDIAVQRGVRVFDLLRMEEAHAIGQIAFEAFIQELVDAAEVHVVPEVLGGSAATSGKIKDP